MQIAKILDTKTAAIVAIGAIGAIAIYYAEKKAGEAAGTIGHAINPLNDDNIFSSGVDAVGAKLSGNPNFSLGVWIYDITH